MKDYGDEKTVADQNSKLGRELADRRVVWKTLLSEKPGRDFLWWLLERGNIYSSTYRATDRDSAFAEGQRSMLIPIQSEIILADPKGYTQMVIEHAAIQMETTDE